MGALSALVVLYRAVIILSPRMRAYLLYIRFRLIKREVINTIVKKSKMGDWFLFYMLGQVRTVYSRARNELKEDSLFQELVRYRSLNYFKKDVCTLNHQPPVIPIKIWPSLRLSIIFPWKQVKLSFFWKLTVYDTLKSSNSKENTIFKNFSVVFC